MAYFKNLLFYGDAHSMQHFRISLIMLVGLVLRFLVGFFILLVVFILLLLRDLTHCFLLFLEAWYYLLVLSAEKSASLLL